MKKRSFYTLWATLLLGTVMLAGCAGANGGNKTDSSGPAKTSSYEKSNTTVSAEQPKEVTIEYWQYEFPAKVELINELIKQFEQEHPHITVKQTNFPYDQYNQKVATLVPAGKGPDVINLYYGWLPKYVSSGYLQPLPESEFPAADIEEHFFPFVETAKLGGKYYALPTGVRTLGLYYNKDLFTKAGLDPAKPPTTWEELVEYAKQLTERDSKGQFVIEGFAWEPGSQLHHWFRDGLLYQAGGQDTSEDRKRILWNESPAGLEAFKYLIDFAKEHKVGINGFYTDDANAFKTGHAAINVDGSYRLGSLRKDAPDLNYAIAPLPAYKNKSTQASFWANAIPSTVKDEKLAAATEFLKFLTSKGVQEQWVERIGELPAQKEVALQDKYVNDEFLGAFIAQLPDGRAHFFIDETQERTLFIEAVDQVLLTNVPIDKAFAELVAKTQKLYDDYWSKQGN
ncbi:extracellular solute-binding protein [Paenibacillus sp. GCM10012307]|nr:extracellular solute-binding protein [Paenibacillus roseus]